MRSKIAFAFVAALGAAVAVAVACGGDDNGSTPQPDASMEGGDDSGDDCVLDNGPPPDTAPTVNCQLGDKTDPIALCTQKTILKAILQFHVYAKGQGMPSTYDSQTFVPGSDHTWQSDLAFASSNATYHCNSAIYGDNEITPQLDALLPDVAGLLEHELATLPDDYDGENYFRLRNVQVGLSVDDATTDATKVQAIADAYGSAIQSKYAQSVPAMGDGGVAGVVLGRLANGAVAYEPAKVVMGAAALLDMAQRHAGDPDAGTMPAQWQATALAALDYVNQRARDATTGLYFDSLVTSGDPGHDALASGDAGTLSTDVQAPIILGLARAQDLFNQLQGQVDGGAGPDAALPTYPYWVSAQAIVAGLNTAGLWDGVSDTTSTAPGAFMEGLLAGGTVDTNKTTLGNALLFGGFHRVVYGVGSPFSYELRQLRGGIIQAMPPNTSLFSVVQGIGQMGFLRAASRDWHSAVTFSADAGAGGPEPGATLYRTDAMAAMIEGFTELWLGSAHSATCAF
jgi:hypothetical protein